MKLGQTLDKAAKALQQRQAEEHGSRNARIDEWLASQDLPRALPALKPLPKMIPSIGNSSVTSSFRTQAELEFKSSRDSQQTKSTAMAMKIGALPHSQWNVQRGGSFTRGNSFSTRDGADSTQAPGSPALRPGLPPSLPALPPFLQAAKK